MKKASPRPAPVTLPGSISPESREEMLWKWGTELGCQAPLRLCKIQWAPPGEFTSYLLLPHALRLLIKSYLDPEVLSAKETPFPSNMAVCFRLVPSFMIRVTAMKSWAEGQGTTWGCSGCWCHSLWPLTWNGAPEQCCPHLHGTSRVEARF